jgi:hypothetical protein
MSGPGRTSWLKIRNFEYSQWTGRRELFEAGRDKAAREVRLMNTELALL